MVNCVCKCEIVLECGLLIIYVTLNCVKTRHEEEFDFQPLTVFLEGEAGAITLDRSMLLRTEHFIHQ